LSGEDRRQAKYEGGVQNPQALNRYSYVLNNPLRYTDPTGHDVRCYTPGCAGSVTNNSNGPIDVIGERRIPGCTANTQECFQVVIVTLQPGESTVDYGIVDPDFILPSDENPLKPSASAPAIMGRKWAYKMVDGMDVAIGPNGTMQVSCRTRDCVAAIVATLPILRQVAEQRGNDPPGWWRSNDPRIPVPERRLGPGDKVR
jgi:hypothetical protein